MIVGSLPPAQQAIRDRCVHPSGGFVSIGAEEIEQSIPSRFEQQVERHPTKPAIRTRTHTLTYEALNRRANRIARAIVDRRGSQQEPIALLLENDAPMIAAMLGVLKAGKFYVPLDPSLPLARRASILEDSTAALLVTNRRCREVASEHCSGRIEWIDIDELADTGATPDNLRLPISPDALTWMFHTSGSTGKPKGAVQNHRNVLHYVRTYTNALHLSAEDRFSLLLSFGVNAAAHEIYCALLNGACLYPLDLKSEGVGQLAAWLIQHEVTIYCSVPTIFRHFCDGLTGVEAFPQLRLVKLVGEPVLIRDVELYRKHFGADCIFVNRFGSTETGTVRWNFIDDTTSLTDHFVPIGYEVEDNEIMLLNESGVEAAVGEVGEIVVRGPYLSPGYWRQPELTEQAFSSDPLGGQNRIYRTGDIGRFQSDGSLVHLGRKDFQVKILGHRVELMEIEAALLSHADVGAAIVMAREDPHGERRLVAYLLAKGAARPSMRDVRQFLASRLPGHMVPSVFLVLERFPLAQNGKVHRSALPAPQWTRPELETPFVAPVTAAERTLSGIWAEVLGVDRVGTADNFFDLGGHSLLAMRVNARIEASFGKRLPVSALLQAPTVAQLATMLDQAGPTGSLSTLVTLQATGSKSPFFWVHGEVSNAFLPRYLGPDQPLYGLLQQSRDGARAKYTSIEDIATHYLDELRAVQPAGPYSLGGYCVGGTLAFEMAQQLQRQGEVVALLVLLDPPKPVEQRWAAQAWSRLESRIRAPLKAVVDAAKTLAWQVYSLARPAHLIPPALRIHYIHLIHQSALRRYVSQPYPGRVVLLTTEDSCERREGWERLAVGGLETSEAAGSHTVIVFEEPRIQGLAALLKPHLDLPR